MKKNLLSLVLLLSSITVFAQAFLPLVSGSSATLGSIAFSDENTGYAIGSTGTILRTLNGGSTWTIQSSGVTADLTEVACVDMNTAYVVGRAGLILKTTNGGINWNPLSSGVTTDLTRITINGADIYVSGYSGVMLKSSNAGLSWMPLTTGSSTFLYANCFTDANTGYVVGHLGTILKTVNAGASWTALSSGTSFQLLGIAFTDANNGYAVGGDISSNTGIILRTTDAGFSWTSQIVSNNYFGNVRFLSATTGFIAGGDITANTSTILKTTDAGINWIAQTSSSSRQFGAAFPGYGAGYNCGLNGTILKTTGINAGLSTLEDVYSLSAYPNPVLDGSFTLEFNVSDKAARLEILLLDISGREQQVVACKLFHPGTQKLEVDMKALPAGMYFIRITSSQGVQTKKMIKI